MSGLLAMLSGVTAKLAYNTDIHAQAVAQVCSLHEAWIRPSIPASFNSMLSLTNTPLAEAQCHQIVHYTWIAFAILTLVLNTESLRYSLMTMSQSNTSLGAFVINATCLFGLSFLTTFTIALINADSLAIATLFSVRQLSGAALLLAGLYLVMSATGPSQQPEPHASTSSAVSSAGLSPQKPSVAPEQWIFFIVVALLLGFEYVLISGQLVHVSIS